MEVMIDYHCHILPGLDDGCRSWSEAVEMARILAAAGMTCVHCTPHCRCGLYETLPEQVRDGVQKLRENLHQAGVELQVKAGMEYYLDEFFFDHLDEPLLLGDSQQLLFEMAPNGNIELLKQAVFEIRRRGLTPVLAHPERYPALWVKKRPCRLAFRQQRRRVALLDEDPLSAFPAIVRELRDMGCLLQGNLGSFSGIYGRDCSKTAKLLYQGGYYHCFGSDGHSPGQLSKALANCRAVISP